MIDCKDCKDKETCEILAMIEELGCKDCKDKGNCGVLSLIKIFYKTKGANKC